jgi:hypothetical protein
MPPPDSPSPPVPGSEGDGFAGPGRRIPGMRLTGRLAGPQSRGLRLGAPCSARLVTPWLAGFVGLGVPKPWLARPAGSRVSRSEPARALGPQLAGLVVGDHGGDRRSDASITGAAAPGGTAQG